MEDRYLTEAFKELKLLNEDTFDITTDDALKLKDYIYDNKSDDIETIIDPLAETEEELQDSYLGKAVLDCVICQSKIYKDPKLVIIDNETNLANEGEECPYCHSVDGYKVIGQIEKFKAENAEHSDEEMSDSTNIETEDDNKIKSDEVIDSEEAKENSVKQSDTVINEDLNINIASENEDTDININTSTTDSTDELPNDTKDDSLSDEVITPVTAETEEQFKDVDIDEFEENDFDQLGEGYLKKVYENVKSYKTTSGKINDKVLKLEGLITFKSGKSAKTNFIFEAKSINRSGKLAFIGENKQLARGKKSFTLQGVVDGKKLISESLTYNYRAKDTKTNESKRVYGKIVKN